MRTINELKKILDNGEMELIYRYQEHLYLLEDARYHLESLVEEEELPYLVTEDDCEEVVRAFKHRRSAVEDDHSIWMDVIYEYRESILLDKVGGIGNEKE